MRPAARVDGMEETVFARYGALVARTGALNLASGSPDEDGPALVREAARQAIADGFNQYAPGRGIPTLRAAVAAHQAQHHMMLTFAEGLVHKRAQARHAGLERRCRIESRRHHCTSRMRSASG